MFDHSGFYQHHINFLKLNFKITFCTSLWVSEFLKGDRHGLCASSFCFCIVVRGPHEAAPVQHVAFCWHQPIIQKLRNKPLQSKTQLVEKLCKATLLPPNHTHPQLAYCYSVHHVRQKSWSVKQRKERY